MKIKNPLDKDITLQFEGETYVLEAGVSKEFPERVAARWFTIYEFLKITHATDKQVDEVVEEVVKKAPKKAAKKVAKEDKEDEG